MKSKLLSKAKYIYLVGIKGVGMTGLAQILKSQGKKISGSDTTEKFFTDQVLKKLKIPFKEGFSENNIPKNTDLIIYSTAFNPSNHPELKAAQKRKIPILSYPEALSQLFNHGLGIAISGSHGKTTTSALIAESLKNLGLSPTALIGSRVVNWKANALTGKSPFFVIEADEHQNKLRYYLPWSLIITNIDYDHPDYYRKSEDYYQSFKKWVGKWKARKTEVPKIGVFNGDDPKTKRLMRELKLKNSEDLILLTYGKGKENNIRIVNIRVSSHQYPVPSKAYFEVRTPKYDNQNSKIEMITIKTSLIGEHNAYNLAAAYAFIFGLLLGTGNWSLGTLRKIAKSFSSFQGTERRMQYIGKREKVAVYDDYAHHPQEIKATLEAFRNNFPKNNIFVIFQPHTYTRTKAFLPNFAKVLSKADYIGLLEIYGSAREASGNISSANIQKLLQKRKKQAFYFKTHKDCLEFLHKFKFKKPTILVTMGAGDGWRVGTNFLKKWKMEN